MDLSVCIPVYNVDVRKLIESLRKEIVQTNIKAEIILIDDASEKNIQLINTECEALVDQFFVLEENVGRSRIRNMFLKYASGKSLLFLDCDVEVNNPLFLNKYLREINNFPTIDALYGGFSVKFENQSLRNLYSREKETKVKIGSSDFSLLKTVNFSIKRSVFQDFKFAEEITQYGYEDFLFAKVLQSNGKKFRFFDNPVWHLDDSTNEEYLNKVKTSIQTLITLENNSNYSGLIREVKLLQVIYVL